MIEMMEMMMMMMMMMMLKNWHPLFASQTPRSSPRRSSASCGSSWGQKIIIRCVAFSHLYKSQELGTPTFGASPPFCFPVASWMLGLPGSPQGSPHPHLRTLSKAQQSPELSAFAEETSSIPMLSILWNHNVPCFRIKISGYFVVCCFGDMTITICVVIRDVPFFCRQYQNKVNLPQ